MRRSRGWPPCQQPRRRHSRQTSGRGSGLEACRPGYVCLYENWQDNQGAAARILRANEDNTDLDDLNFNDVTSPAYNNTDHVVRVFPHFDNQVVPVTPMPGEHMSFDGVNGTFNDVASSVHLVEWRSSQSWLPLSVDTGDDPLPLCDPPTPPGRWAGDDVLPYL